MGEVRAPSSELSRRCGTFTRMNAGIPASSALLRSQSPLRPHSTTELRAQSMGAEPSSGAAGTADGRTAEPASIPIAISRLITFSSSAYFTV
jgi:hypothetical protein